MYMIKAIFISGAFEHGFTKELAGDALAGHTSPWLS